MKKIILMLTVVFLFIIIACPLPAQKGKRLKIGDTCPGFFVKQIDGGNFFLNDYIGEKAANKSKGILFSFCSSTCIPCIKEIPELEKILKKYQDAGLRIILVNVGESEKLARKLIAEVNTKLPVLLDRYMVVSSRLGVSATPYTILVDESGIIRYINTGYAEDNAEKFIALLEEKIVDVLGL